ncbi:proline-rich domain-containing protein [Streptomyces sp. S.PNR 29]|uniref:proline-rich domain-containing protein n=1 Tax=Streptomyces sp. S.PNR 29 TaxID=2973805 RepID=UPI0025B20CBD|nr:proline-rich domain-containing protein [Streptomyces sp. S.PNR 29]MDN0194953.1 DUF3824 domain-containing protein [Streptomyces sp. S.PNR 29]
MTSPRPSWTGGTLTARTFLKPHRVARAVFHPTWIPGSLDPTVDVLKRVRVIAGAVAALGVYTYVEGGFAFEEMLDNAATASVVLLFLTPVTVGVMLYVWQRSGGGTARQLREPLVASLKLLLLFVGSVVATVLAFGLSQEMGTLVRVLVGLAGLWAVCFVGAGAFFVSGNFFGTAAVHRCLPPLLAAVTSWLMALFDLVTGDLHGLGLTLGIVFILGAPLTVTGIALLEMRRLKRHYGIRLLAHPATLPRITPPPPPMPPATPPYVPAPGQPYGNPYGNPYGVPPQGGPYGHPYAPPGSGNPYAPQPPYHPQGPYGPYGG